MQYNQSTTTIRVHRYWRNYGKLEHALRWFHRNFGNVSVEKLRLGEKSINYG